MAGAAQAPPAGLLARQIGSGSVLRFVLHVILRAWAKFSSTVASTPTRSPRANVALLLTALAVVSDRLKPKEAKRRKEGAPKADAAEAAVAAEPDAPAAATGKAAKAASPAAAPRRGESALAVHLSPFELITDEDGRLAGLRELLAAVGASFLGTWALVLRNRAAVQLIAAQHTRDRAMWARALMVMPSMMLFHSFALQLWKVVRSSLALSWRISMTRRLHGLYFSNMSYYRLLNGDDSVRVENPDTIICTDVQAICESWASVPILLINGVVSTTLLGGEFAQRRGGKAGAVTPLFIFFVAPALLHIAKQFDTTALQVAVSAASARYTQALTRVQLHAERICMLRGERREMGLLGRHLGSAASAQLALERALQGLDLVGLMISGGNSGTSSGSLIHTVGAATASAVLVGSAQGEEAAAATSSAPLAENKASAESFGGLLGDQATVTYSFAAWGSLAASGAVLAASTGQTKNVLDFYGRLKRVAAQASAARASPDGGTFKDSGPTVSFEGVTVQTPTGHTLLEDLAFTVRQGETLLVTGHNGAGKSSIVRCLCSLWDVPRGTIARPGGAVQAEEDLELHSQLYYLPQKPCNVLGSLSDQLTYPLREPGGLPESELRQWLSYVDLEYLLDKKLYSTEEVDEGTRNWDETLSIGEQQALSIARLLYHRPRFAILDECTSAVSRGLERRLFCVARELGIACITIAHRPVLEDHHMRALRLTGAHAKDGRGWRVDELPNCAALAEHRPFCGGLDEAHRRIRDCIDREEQEVGAATRQERRLYDTSREFSASDISERAAECGTLVQARWPSFLARARAVLALGLGSSGARRAPLRMVLVLALVHLKGVLTWEGVRTTAGGFCAAMRGDARGVREQFMGNLLCLPLGALAEYLLKQQIAQLCTELWRGTNMELQRRAFAGSAFFRVMRPSDPRVPYVENPVQRLSEVSGNLRGLMALLLSVLQPTWLFLYLLRVFYSAGGLSLTLAPASAAVIYGLLRVVAPNWKSLATEAAELNGRYQILHTRLHHIAEAVAFSGGGAAERAVIDPHFSRLTGLEARRLRTEFLFGMLHDFLTSPDKVPELARQTLVRGFVVHGGTGAASGSAEAMCASYLYERCVDVTHSLVQAAVNGGPQLESLDAGLQRILELVVAFDAVDATPGGEPLLESGPAAESSSGGPAIAVQGLELVSLQREGGSSSAICLAKELSLDLRDREPLMITGPSSCGKTLLASILLGLVPCSGEVASVALPGSAPCKPGAYVAHLPLSVLFSAPQHVYLTRGDLGSQVCYPEEYAPDAKRHARMLMAVQRAGLEHILTREEAGWSAERVWEDVLSGGEQQRLALARVMYHRPRFAILDDCTSMVQSDAEAGLYRTLLQEFGVTPLCMSQRMFMSELFPRELRLGLATDRGWALGSGPAPERGAAGTPR